MGLLFFIQSNGSVLEMNVMNWARFPAFLPKFLSFFPLLPPSGRGVGLGSYDVNKSKWRSLSHPIGLFSDISNQKENFFLSTHPCRVPTSSTIERSV